MHELLTYAQTISPLDKDAHQDFLRAFEPVTFQKGEYLVKDGQVARHYYFIRSGLVKSFFFKNDKEFIMKFFKERMLFTENSSYHTQVPSKYSLLALEETQAYRIGRDGILQLCHKHHCIERLFGKLASYSTLGMMKRISEMLEDNASERYAVFLQDNKDLLQRISLGDLACYLGITQVSLSRIRSTGRF